MKALFMTTAILGAAALAGRTGPGPTDSAMGMVEVDRHVVETHPSQGDVREIAGTEAVRIATGDGVFASLPAPARPA